MKYLQKEWRIKNKEHMAKCEKEHRKTIRGNLDSQMTAHIRIVLRENKAGRTWRSLVGYTVDDLQKTLESKFVNGMSWEAFLRGKIHIDHIIPKSRFHYEKPEDAEFKVCWGLSNLQPLWAKDNLSKHDKTMEEWQQYKTQTAGAGIAMGGLQV